MMSADRAWVADGHHLPPDGAEGSTDRRGARCRRAPDGAQPRLAPGGTGAPLSQVARLQIPRRVLLQGYRGRGA